MTRGRWLVGLSVLTLVAACGQNALPKADGPPTTAAAQPREPDIPPNHVDNNGWKYPKDMSPDDKQAADTIIGWLRPKLEALHAKRDFSVESTRKAIADFGYPDAEVRPMNDPTYPGAVFGFSVRGGCIKGAVQPEQVMIDASRPIPDWGCMPVGATH